MSADFQFTPLEHIPVSVVTSPTVKKSQAEPVVLQIIQQLGEKGVDPGVKFNIVATRLGVQNPKAIFTNHLGHKALIKGWEGNAQKSLIILEALSKAKNLTLEERYELVSMIPPPYLNQELYIKTFLDSLELSASAQAYWKEKLSLANSNLLQYLPLITDKNFYEKINPDDNSNDQVVLFLYSLKDSNNKHLLDTQIKQNLLSSDINSKMRFINKVLKNSTLASEILPLFFFTKIAEITKAYQNALELTKNEIHSVIFALSDKGLLLSDLQSFFTELPIAERTQLFQSFFSHPSAITPQMIDALTLKTFSNPQISSPMHEEAINLIKTNAPKFEGVSSEKTRELLNRVIVPGYPAKATLYLFQALYACPPDLITELSGKNRADAIVHLLKATLFTPIVTNEQKKQLLTLLDTVVVREIIRTEYQVLLAGDLTKLMKFSQAFEDIFQNSEIRNEFLDTHLKTLNTSPELALQWKKWWNENPLPIPMKALENLTLMLPSLSDRNVFEKLAASKDSPLISLTQEAMKIAGPDQKPLLIGSDINSLLGDANKSTYFTMLTLTCQNPLSRPFLSTHQTGYFGNLALDMEKLNAIMRVYDNPKLAVVWALTYTKAKKDSYDSDQFTKNLSAEEKEQLLEFMFKNKEFWDQGVIKTLTSNVVVTDKSSFIKSSLTGMNLPTIEQEKFIGVILSTESEKGSLWSMITPYLVSLTSEDRSKIKFDGTNSQILLSLLIVLLQKNENYAPSTMEKIKILSTLPEDIILKLNTAIMTLPEASSKILRDLCRMVSVDLSIEGSTPNSWEAYAKSQLGRVQIKASDTTVLQKEMAERWSQIKAQKPEEKPASWLESLEREGWSPFKILGRTRIYRNAEGKYLAVKWQKKGEDVQELYKEAITLDVLHKHKKNLGLLSEYPKPKGVFEFKGAITPQFFQDVTVPIEAKEGKAIAYVYEFPNDSYFAYLHDPKEGQDPEKVAKDYALARHALIADLFTLAKNGLIMSQLADIFHRSEGSRGRDDSGRFMAMNFLVRNWGSYTRVGEFSGVGSGRLHHLETAVEFVNAGYSGVRDAGDSLLLSQIMQPGFEFTETYFSWLIQNKPSEAATFILANFLAEYLLVYELTITERMAHFKENQLDWKDPQKVKALATELRDGFVNAMRYYSGISRNIVEKFLDNAGIDWERASKQLQFFSRKDEKGYLFHNEPELFPKEIYGEEVRVDGMTFWNLDEGMSDGGDTRHRGTVSGTDPVKEPERGRVIMVTSMLLLDKARNQARKKRIEANALLASAVKGTPEEKIAAQKALALYQDSLEYWPYDKRTYSGMEQAFTVLGDQNNAKECRLQRAALVLQNSWEHHLRETVR